MKTNRTESHVYRRELSPDGPAVGKAEFTAQKAAQAAHAIAAIVVPPNKPPRRYHVKRGGRPSRRDRGLK